MRRVHGRVSGRVQGVGFRWSTRIEAERLGLTGWVRNRADGTVETEFEGGDQPVEAMIAWLAAGPPGARVDRRDVEDVAPAGGTGFSVRPDA